jgi:hypothetical protein
MQYVGAIGQQLLKLYLLESNMGLVVYGSKPVDVDWPAPGSKMIIEDNIGDEFPIHIHFGWGTTGIGWKVRLHFTYEEFFQFCDALEQVGEL